MIKSGIKQLVKLFNHKCGIRQREAARKTKCTKPLVNWAYNNKTSIRKRKQAKISKRTTAQKKNITETINSTRATFK